MEKKGQRRLTNNNDQEGVMEEKNERRLANNNGRLGRGYGRKE